MCPAEENLREPQAGSTVPQGEPQARSTVPQGKMHLSLTCKMAASTIEMKKGLEL